MRSIYRMLPFSLKLKSRIRKIFIQLGLLKIIDINRSKNSIFFSGNNLTNETLWNLRVKKTTWQAGSFQPKELIPIKKILLLLYREEAIPNEWETYCFSQGMEVFVGVAEKNSRKQFSLYQVSFPGKEMEPLGAFFDVFEILLLLAKKTTDSSFLIIKMTEDNNTLHLLAKFDADFFFDHPQFSSEKKIQISEKKEFYFDNLMESDLEIASPFLLDLFSEKDVNKKLCGMIIGRERLLKLIAQYSMKSLLDEKYFQNSFLMLDSQRELNEINNDELKNKILLEVRKKFFWESISFNVPKPETHVFFSDWIPFDAIRHIAVVRLDHIGDAYLSLPALKLLREKFPSALITIICGPWNENIFRKAGFNSIVSIPFFGEKGIGAGLNGLTDNDKEILRLLNCDLAIDLRTGDETREVLRYIPAQITLSFPSKKFFPTLNFPYEGGNIFIHQSYQTRFLIDRLSTYDRNEVKLVRKNSNIVKIGLSPSASAETKRLPFSRWIELIKILKKCGLDLQLFCGPSEKDLCTKISKETGISLHPIVSVENYPDVVFNACDIYIGHDTGPSHGVAMTGLPVLEILGGVASPLEWMSFGPNVIALTRSMSCSPCYFHEVNQCPNDLKCFDIPVEDVLWGIGKLLTSCYQM